MLAHLRTRLESFYRSAFGQLTMFPTLLKTRAPLLIGSWLFFNISLALAQIPHKQWDKRFGGTGTELSESVIHTSDGGYLLAGSTDSGIGGDKSQPSLGEYDFWIVKMDKQGQKQWDKRFGSPDYDLLYSVIQTSDGGYLLAGSASGIGGDKSEPGWGDGDYWVIKIDAQGNKQWDKRFGGSRYDGVRSVIQSSDGGYLLAGYSASQAGGDKSEYTRGSYDYWVVKIDGQGTKQWDKRFGGSYSENLGSVSQSSNGSYLLAGNSDSQSGGDKSESIRNENWDEFHDLVDYWVVKIDAQGTKQWDKSYGGNSFESPALVLATADGGYLLFGSSESGIGGDKSETSQGASDFWVVKATSEILGTSVVRINAGGPAYISKSGTQFQADVYYEGNTKTTPYQNYGIANTVDDNLYRTDRVGNVDKNTFRYQIPVANGNYRVRLHFTENYFTASGKRIFSVAAEGEAKLVNYDIYAEVGRTTAVIKTYPVTVSDGNLTLDFSATVNRAKINAIEVLPGTYQARHQSEALAIQETTALLQAAPNPFSEQTTLRLQLGQTQMASLHLYDLQGQLVRTLFAGELKAGTVEQIYVDGTGLSAGVYVVRLVTAEQVSRLKIVLNK